MLKKLNVAPITLRFKDITNAVIKKLKAEMASGNGKAIYKDYITAIDKYFIPTLGKFAVNNIGYKELELFVGSHDSRGPIFFLQFRMHQIAFPRHHY